MAAFCSLFPRSYGDSEITRTGFRSDLDSLPVSLCLSVPVFSCPSPAPPVPLYICARPCRSSRPSLSLLLLLLFKVSSLHIPRSLYLLFVSPFVSSADSQFSKPCPAVVTALARRLGQPLVVPVFSLAAAQTLCAAYVCFDLIFSLIQ